MTFTASAKTITAAMAWAIVSVTACVFGASTVHAEQLPTPAELAARLNAKPLADADLDALRGAGPGDVVMVDIGEGVGGETLIPSYDRRHVRLENGRLVPLEGYVRRALLNTLRAQEHYRINVRPNLHQFFRNMPVNTHSLPPGSLGDVSIGPKG